MDTLLKCILEIYRAAQDTPVDEFQTLALKMLQAMVPFRSATWSNLTYGPRELTVYGMHLFNEPEDLVEELPAMNSRHSVTLEKGTCQGGVAVAFYTPTVYARDDEADMRDYIQRYGHENNLFIADIDRPYSRGEWLSLYRPGSHAHFTARDQQAVTLLTPHLVEAMAINRKLALGKEGHDPSQLGGTRALIKSNGMIIHCGSQFCELLQNEWSEWRYSRLPAHLLAALQKNGTAATVDGTTRIKANKLGDLLFLSAKRVSIVGKLSKRERTVVQLYSNGKSYKEIARTLNLSPITIRNFIQHAYRKLGIDNKASLARLLQTEFS